jgi:hypothetical protein
MSSRISRLSHAWSRQDFGMLFREPPSPNPRVLMHAGVRARLGRLAPFFEQDSQIYPLVHRDTLYWMVPLYAHSATYPFSSTVTVGGKHHQYFHYAATALINSASGRVNIFVPQSGDPVARMWRAALPTFFHSQNDLPPDIAAHLPPAIDGAFAQAVAYARVGTREDSLTGGALPAEWLYADDGAELSRELAHVPALHPSGAWIQPVLDSVGLVHHLLIALGGSTPQSYRMPVEPRSILWRDLQRSFDLELTRLSSQHATPLSGGAIRVFLEAGRPIFVRTAYQRLPNGMPQLSLSLWLLATHCER